MNGVEILATEQIGTAFGFNSKIFFTALAVYFIVSLIGGVIVAIKESDPMYILAIVIAGTLIGFICGITSGFTKGVPTEYTTQYKVTISDEVLMNEFNERYEIISQEGKIYTVRDREAE